MAIVKITIYDDNKMVDKIEKILSESETKHTIKHGESFDSKFDIIIFEKNDSILEFLRNKFKTIQYEIVDINIDNCDMDDFPLPHLIPDNPDKKDYTVSILIGVYLVLVVIGIILI
jgi:hypothetical protein